MSNAIRKTTFCISCENKTASQLRGNNAADQTLCFCFIDAHAYLSLHLVPVVFVKELTIYEPRREKTGFLHMRKQRRRSASL